MSDTVGGFAAQPAMGIIPESALADGGVVARAGSANPSTVMRFADLGERFARPAVREAGPTTFAYCADCGSHPARQPAQNC
ncbi:hypothetical protein [Nocardia fluminea]|uniref:hypothetical protein n=1 Tax=Nocardia fluminea TaxID=134984 RepID=UPI003408A50B